MSLTLISNPDIDPLIKTWRISSLSDFIHYLEEYCDDELTIFRGQREDKSLLPRIARLDPIHLDILSTEEEMIRQFEREAISFIQNMPQNDWDLLALAQHHGLPTRLLDWTRNPLAGLWFAIRNPPKNKKKNAVVWVLRPEEDEDVVRIADPRSSPFRLKRTKVFIPRHISTRIRSQDGIFTVHKFLLSDKVVPLNNQKNYKSKLEKILISPGKFPNIRYELDRCGINASTLFPDLDGLAQRIEWKYTLTKDE